MRWLLKLSLVFAAAGNMACGGVEERLMESTVCCDSHLNSAQKQRPSCVVIDGADVTACPPTQGFGVAFVVDSEAGGVTASATLSRNFTTIGQPVAMAPGACALYGVVSPPGDYAQCLTVTLAPENVAQVRPGVVVVPSDQPAQGVALCNAQTQCAALESQGSNANGEVTYGPVMAMPGLAVDLQGVSTPAIGEVGACGLGGALLAMAVWKLRLSRL